MNEQVIEAAAAYTGFTPWELILMSAVVGLFAFLWRMYAESRKLHRESIEAMNNSTHAINNNTTAFKEFKTEIAGMIKESRR